MTSPRLLAAERRDDDVDASLRPQRLADFIGQEKARANLRVFIEASRASSASTSAPPPAR
jgi:Holliday junction DNA helicase RuvB